MASQVVLVVKNLPANAGDIRDMGLIRGSGRSPGGQWLKTRQFCYSSAVQNCDACLSRLKLRYQQDCLLSGDTRGETLSCTFSSFQNLPTFHGSWPPSVRDSSTAPHRSVCCSPSSPTTAGKVAPLKNPCDYLGAAHIMQGSLFISGSLTSSHQQSPFGQGW